MFKKSECCFFFWHHQIVDVKGGNYGLFVNLPEVVVSAANYIFVSVVVIFASLFNLFVTFFVCWQWLIDCTAGTQLNFGSNRMAKNPHAFFYVP